MTPEARDQVHRFVEQARWFGGKGRTFAIGDSRRLVLQEAAEGVPTVTVELVDLAFEGGESDTYQLPTVYYATEQEQLAHAHIGSWDDAELGAVHAYDALHDHASAPLWVRSLADGLTRGAGADEVRFVRVGSHDLDVEARSSFFSGQQSNSSVIFGEDSLLKVFRRVTPGVNPDIEILAALSEAGNENVATLYGYVETSAGSQDAAGEVLQLGILQQFLRTASDGFDLALASLRGLFGDGGDMTAREAGGDFASESHRLGRAVAQMHTDLAAAFGTETWDPEHLDGLTSAMTARLDAALPVVPGLEAHADALRALFARVGEHPREVTAQRVHGDLHLGQTLRTVSSWKIIDFEGEPAKPLDERRRPDSPWRDVAGMLRSFDYAAELTRLDHEQATGDSDHHDAERARDWSSRNAEAFLAGYRDASGASVDQVLLTAYTADKAVYEAVYEARNRPSWLPIPLSALARIAS